MTGQEAYELWRAAVPEITCNVPGGPWEELPEPVRAGFDAVAARQEVAAASLAAALAGLEIPARVRSTPDGTGWLAIPSHPHDLAEQLVTLIGKQARP